MSITEIAKHLWLHSHRFTFGHSESWPDNLFTKAWADAQEPVVPWRAYKSGWYWFLVDMNLGSLHAVQRPPSLPASGCDIGALSHSNSETFGPHLLCKPDAKGKLVVYNGHDGRVCDRVRAHFSLNNNQTGALGLKHFPLHQQEWEVRMFAAPCLDSLPVEDRGRVQLLMTSKSGRRAVETAWRAEFGWPVLCKE
jgi:hypothetical protein